MKKLMKAISIILGAAVVLVCTKYPDIQAFHEKWQRFEKWEDDYHPSIDYLNATLGKARKESQLLVYTQPASASLRLTDAGFANIKALSKYQKITYHSDVQYFVDLSQLTKKDIRVSEDKHLVTITIPDPTQGKITIDPDKTTVSDVKRESFLAIGDLHLSPEELKQGQQGAVKEMQKTLDEMKISAAARTAAKESTENFLGLAVHSVSEGMNVEVKLQSESSGADSATASTAD